MTSLAFLAAGLAVILMTGPTKAAPACDQSVQALVDRAAPGTTVDLPDGCVYREAVVIKKPLTLKGGPGVEIRGSDVWSSFARTSSGRWRSDRSVPNFGSDANVRCKPNTGGRCAKREQVFFDGRPLRQVDSSPTAGEFALDAGRHVLLANNPVGHKVEVTTREFWLKGAAGVANVTIDDINFRHAANARSGALSNGAGNWTIENCDIAYAHATNVSMTNFGGLKLLNNNIHHGGQMGASSNNVTSMLVRGNKIHDNNIEAFDPSWAAGGMKITDANGFTADANEVYNNDHHGFWTDTGSRNVTFANNRIYHNVQSGIDVEITDGIDIHGNVIYDNGWGDPGDGITQAGVFLRASRDANVYNNTLAWNDDGITIMNSRRDNGVGGSDPIYDTVSDVHVHDNTTLSKDYGDGRAHMSLAWVKTYAGGNIYDRAANNRGYDNRYWYYAPEGSQGRYKWDGNFAKLMGFNNTPGEERGRYMTQIEKDRVVAAKKIPARPAH